ncbi:RNA-directed DNA polymerase, eukaryota, reverse transcriptase zinc-binding domain protein [Tanacetum coccineum]
MGNMNVTLDPNEHTAGGYSMTKDMQDFKDCVNSIEVEDIASSGLFYTWTKNLKKTKQGDNSGILKKLDRVMRNEAFVGEYPFAHFIFLPYLISDHCPTILVMPNTIQERKRDYGEAMKEEEKLLFQKAKIKWLSMGDRNNAFFHRALKSKYIRNRISVIHDERGTRFEGDQVTLCKNDADFMVRDISNSEIKKAMFMIDDNKAPGPDGYTSHFFKKSWDILGDEVCKAIMKCVTSTSFSIAVNGESCGFFRGGRGLRQGDPMSPYLFILVMEILNLLMLRKVESNRSFQYHFGCNQLKITHICFADDLLMFCHGDADSVRIIKEVIKEFGDVSGLLPNYYKSTIIFGSVNDEDRHIILDICPFKVESLPVKYLVVPLITKRLRVKDCKSLVDKVRNRILSWKNKVLSYAGRLQLVASILESIQVYWATIFLLPQAVIDDINRLLKGFLWNQSDQANGKAKVPNITLTPDKDDELMWKRNDGVLRKFSLSNAYHDFQNRYDNVIWKDLVWFSQNIPKHAFILWLFKNAKRNVEELFTNLVDTVTQREDIFLYRPSIKSTLYLGVHWVRLYLLMPHNFPVWPWEEIGYYVWLVLSVGGCSLVSDAIPSLPFDPFSEG